MKICIVTDPPYPWGGTEAREIEFAQALRRHGEEVHILCPYLPKECKQMDKLEGLILHGRTLQISNKSFDNPVSNLFYYYKNIKKLKNDIDIFHYANHGRAAMGSLLKKVLKTPTVSSLHSIRPPYRNKNINNLNEFLTHKEDLKKQKTEQEVVSKLKKDKEIIKKNIQYEKSKKISPEKKIIRPKKPLNVPKLHAKPVKKRFNFPEIPRRLKRISPIKQSKKIDFKKAYLYLV